MYMCVSIQFLRVSMGARCQGTLEARGRLCYQSLSFVLFGLSWFSTMDADLPTHGLLEFFLFCFLSPHRSPGITDMGATCPAFSWVLRLQTQILIVCGECFYPLSHLSRPKQVLKDELPGILLASFSLLR